MPLPPPRRGGSRAATPPSGNKSEWIAKEGERRPPGRGDRPSPSGSYQGKATAVSRHSTAHEP